MALALDESARHLLASPASIKILATSDAQGVPHAVVDPTITLDETDRLVYRERLEGSRTQRDLVAGLWFERPVTVIVVGPDGRTLRVAARPVKAHVAGPIFRRHHEAVRASDPEADLAAVWLLEPDAVSDETYEVARARQRSERPFLVHLDLLAKPSTSNEEGSRP